MNFIIKMNLNRIFIVVLYIIIYNLNVYIIIIIYILTLYGIWWINKISNIVK
jgi:hypothetical protein